MSKVSGGDSPRSVSDSVLPYSGIRILDFTQLEQGPSGTQVLADFGAEVIKIERIDVGEIGRRQAPTLGRFSPHWSATNRNKLSLSVNLKDPEGVGILRDLARTADIVASNFRPGVMDRLGLGYDALSEINPRIICAYASGYGQSGPYRDKRGQDLAAQALGGVMALTGFEGGPPMPVGTFAIDYLASMHFAQGMMLALAAREKTGRGQVVDSCLLNSAIAMHLQEATTYLNIGRTFPRPPQGAAHSLFTALYGYYETRDHAWIVLVGEFYIDEPWRRVARALGLPDAVREDERFQSAEGLSKHVAETTRILQTAFATIDRSDALARLAAEDVLAAPVYDYPELFTDEQVLHNNMVIETEVADLGVVKLVGMPVKLSATPGKLRYGPPTVGQDNERLLALLGIDEAKIEDLQSRGVIGSENREHEQGAPAAW